MPIVAATDRDDTVRRLSIYWGVVPFRADVRENGDSSVLVAKQLSARGIVRPEATLVFVNVHEDVSRPNANFVTIQRT
jgi:pyruvate kinase